MKKDDDDSKMVRISRVVLNYLAKHAVAFEDTPDDVLRRLFKLPAKVKTKRK